jgi:HlyD family secretion protein
MDIARRSHVRNKRLRGVAYAIGGLVTVLLMSLALSRLKPAAPTVARAAVWIDAVRRGPLVRQVRGVGTLVPEDIRWIPATTQGRVDRILLRPGTPVTPQSVILELSNPQLDQDVRDAELKVSASEAALRNLRVQLQNELLQQKAAAAGIAAELSKAQMQAEMNEALVKRQIVSVLVFKQSQVDAQQLAVRDQIAKEQLAGYAESINARVAVQESDIAQARAAMTLKRRQRDELKVRAGLVGVLQLVPVDVGQQVAPGANLARVANPMRLKAEIKIAETEGKDIQIGQRASVDTRNGVLAGMVGRIDPSVQNGTRTVDIIIDGALPKGAVPDLSVDGTIELERLPDVVFVGRPAIGQEQSEIGLFRLGADGRTAERVRVKLGRISVNAVEVISGLSVGDQVVLSDMSAWDEFDRVRIQ